MPTGTGPAFDRVRNLIAIAITALLLLTLFSVAANAQAPTNQSEWGKHVAPSPVPKGMLAVTICENGAPVVHFRNDEGQFHTEATAAELWSHENVHVEQLTRDTTLTCEQAFAKMTGSPQALVRAEAEAYCAQAQHNLHASGTDPLSLIRDAIGALSSYLNNGLDKSYRMEPTEVAHLFMQVCPITNTTVPHKTGTTYFGE